MKTRLSIAAVILVLTASAYANVRGDIFGAYENARQSLLKQSIADVQANAKQLSAVARKSKQPAIASKADALAAATDIKTAREKFGALSTELISFRNAQSGAKPAVAWCPMAKKSWLQPVGEISNPYYDASMRKCGEFK